MTGEQAVAALIKLRGNTRFGVTGPDWGECTAVPHSLQRDILPDPYDVVYGNAKDIFANAPDSLYIKIGPGGTLLPGDVVSEGGDPVLGTDGRFGHTFAVTQKSDTGQPITGYSQNYPTGYQPHIRTFPRNGLIGAIRAKVLQSGGGEPTVDQRYAEDWANLAYQLWFQKVPTAGERQLRTGLPWDRARRDLVAAIDGGAELGLQSLFVIMYEHGLGRDRHAQPGQPGYINIPVEITPRVGTVLNNQNTILDHFINIDQSDERKRYLSAKGGDVSAPKLAQAKVISNQGNQAINNL